MDHSAPKLEDRRVTRIRRLDPPAVLKAELPVGAAAAARVADTRDAIRDLLHGRDPRRLLVVVGPCSIHDEAAALEYAERLEGVARELRDELVVVMRTYFEKPRTHVGWKGFLNDPDLDGSCDVAAGTRRARALMLAILERGMSCATELLDPITPQYLADLLAWAVIGARTTESQTHRAMASGLSMPVGFKNGTDGSLDSAVHAMRSCASPHSFLGIDVGGASAVVETAGNPDRHLVLRGGRSGPNHSAEDVKEAARRAAVYDVPRPVMVDCSHDNSGKDHTRQGPVCRDVLTQVRAGAPEILGLMLESNLEEGRQDWDPATPGRHGVSITDACIGFAETEDLLHEMAEAVRAAPEA